MYPQPKPETITITVEIRAEQNGCPTCSGTGKVPGGLAWNPPGFIACPDCGWQMDDRTRRAFEREDWPTWRYMLFVLMHPVRAWKDGRR